MAKKVFIEFADVLKRVQDSTQLKAKGTGNADIVLSDSYEGAALTFFNDALDVVKKESLHYLRIKNYDGTVVIELNDQVDHEKFKDDKAIIEKCVAEYILFQWYRNIIEPDLAKEALSLFNSYVKDLLNGRFVKSFFKAKSRPFY